MNTKEFTDNNKVCIFCDSTFNGEQCPNCGGTEYRKSQERIEWEENQRRIDEENQRVAEQKRESRESTIKHISTIRLITVIIFLVLFFGMFFLSMLSHYAFRLFLF